MPISCIIAVYSFPDNSVLSSLVIGGLLPFIINTVLMITSKCIRKKGFKLKYPGIDDFTVNCFSQEGF